VPDWKEELRMRLRKLRLSPVREHEIVEELAQHLEDSYQELLSSGMAEAEARQAALAELNDSELLIDELHRVERSSTERVPIAGERGGRNILTNLRQDFRYGLRMLSKKPGFTLIAFFTLALSIGANTAIFSVVNSVLLRQLPFKNPDQVMWVWSSRDDRDNAPFSLPDFIDYREQNQTLEAIAAFSAIGLSLSGPERTERLQGLRVSANLFQLLGVDASAGRTLVAEDDEPARRHVAVLTYDSWQRRFGGDSKIVGKAVNLNGESYVIVGVLPRRYSLPVGEAELAIPLAPDVDPLRNVRSSVNFLRALARLKPGVTRAQAESDLTAIVKRERQQYGDVYLKKNGVRLRPLHEEMVGSVRTALWVLLGAVGLVLLIGCSNLAALSLARASTRRKEMAIRKALGATSSRLVAQMLTESLILALLGGGAGLFLAIWGVRFLLALSPTALPREQEIGVDLRVFAFAATLSIVATVICGILPALQVARTEMNGGLTTTARGAGDGARGNRSRSLLVIAEVALSFLLLIGAGLLIQSFMRVQSVDPGFDPTNAMAIQVSLPKARYQDRAAVTLFCDKLLPRLQALPGVEAVDVVSLLPMSSGRRSVDFTLAGKALSPADAHMSQYRIAGPDYFRAMKIPLVQGRPFDPHDNAGSVQVVLVNETTARRFWPNGAAVGAHINIDDNNVGPRPVEIVGVVGDVKHLGLESEPTFDVYAPMAQTHEDQVGLFTNSHYWVVRLATHNQAFESAFRRELQHVDPEAAASNIRTLDDYISESVAPRQFNLRVLTIFAIAALLLAATGVYGIVSYTVTQRIPEIGIRLALGAGRTRVFRLVLSQGLKVVLAGVLTGFVGALALTRVIRSLLFGITPGDPLTFVVVSSVLILVALMAASVPARRAAKVDPLVALRNE
jgi:predicted permease